MFADGRKDPFPGKQIGLEILFDVTAKRLRVIVVRSQKALETGVGSLSPMVERSFIEILFQYVPASLNQVIE